MKNITVEDNVIKDEEFTISKHDLIDILTKSGIFNSNGIESVLSRDGLKGILAGMMVTIDDSHSRSNYYRDECSRLRDIIHDLESLVDKYEEMLKSESDNIDYEDIDYDILELRDQWDDCDDDW